MVEVVGTAPTSVMVITKFVYRRSWQANTITIKAFECAEIGDVGIINDIEYTVVDNFLEKTEIRRWRGLKKIYDRMYSKTKYLKIHTIYDLNN